MGSVLCRIAQAVDCQDAAHGGKGWEAIEARAESVPGKQTAAPPCLVFCHS